MNFCWNVTRGASIILGAWLAGLLPVELSVDAQRLANEAQGHAPNMEPGVVVGLAFFLTSPILAVVLLAELVRQWGLEREPLSLPSCIALGFLAAWPVGYSFVFPTSHFGNSGIYMVSALGILAFYTTRWLWLRRRR